MSSDNGIFIARFPTSEGYEYRVAHCQNIEDCDEGVGGSTQVADCFRDLKFGDKFARVFKLLSEAQCYADELAQDYDILEYGILELEFDRPLQGWSEKKAMGWLNKRR